MLAYVQPSHLIRRARSGEAALISHLRRASLWCLDLPDASPEAIGALIERVPDVDAGLIETGAYFVAERNGEILGGAGWSPLDAEVRAWLFGEEDRSRRLARAGDAVLVRGFFVDSDESRYTIAMRMMAHVETDAARAGYSSAEIIAPAALQGYYRGMGFRTVCRLDFLHDEETIPLAHMRKAFPVALAAVA